MRPFAALAVASTLLVGVIVASGCTFGGLANYAIENCDPTQPQANDVCNRLNTDPATCTPYQCDVSRRCVQKTRDDDRDGDPPTSCGGTDCDDTNAERSGRAAEKCDLLDNNCNGLVDEDVLLPGSERTVAPAGNLTSLSEPILVPADETRRNVIAAFLANNCIPFVALEPGGGGAVGSGCAVTDASSAPRQPYPLRTSTGNAAAFVATSQCPAGRIAYRFQSSTLQALDLACDAAHPAALPAVAAMPSTANANSGIIAWYEAPLSERTDAVGGCATVKPAPLAVLFVRPSLVDPPDAPDRTSVLLATETSLAIRPPALLPLEAAKGMLLAAPLGNDVGIWLLEPDGLTGTALPTPVHVPIANARAVSVAARTEGDIVRIAIAAEVGCRPQASVQLVLGTLDTKTDAFTFAPPIEVAPASEIATSTSVAWIESRSEWWVAWIDAVPHALVRRFLPDGKAIGGSIAVGTRLPLGAVSAGASIFGVSGSSFVEIPLTCK